MSESISRIRNLKVLVGGGSGFIGHNLVSSLKKSGHSVTLISRTSGKDRISWDEVQNQGLPQCDAIIQIPGANIMEKSWTEERKKEILNSRVGTTNILIKAVELMKEKPKVIVSGSAVGYYPTSSTAVFEFDEDYNGNPAKTFPGKVCSEWEKCLWEAKGLDDVRKVTIRTAMVFGNDGGALQQMLTPFKFGLGGIIGSGKQYWPWIHIDDIVGLFQYATENSEVNGILNGAAPHCVTNEEFTRTLGRVLGRPTFLPMPEFVINFIFGERAILLLEGHKIIPKRTLEVGYTFKYPLLEEALRDLVAV